MTKVFQENKDLCLTPENKMKEWAELVYQTARDGNQVKLYADIESTGLNFHNQGRPVYDPLSDQKMLYKDIEKSGATLYQLENEAKDLSGKVDRMIEFAFVTCYTNKNGETNLLLDKDGEPVYFHEMINPNIDNVLIPEKQMKKMPLVPYAIHKTSFEFLNGEEEHPFLDCKLHKPAPSTKVFLSSLMEFLKGYEEDQLFDNIYMFFHNGDQFDVPFIDAELSRSFEENLTLRDFIQVYDTLPLSKTLIPSPVQKYIAHCQSNSVFLGNENIKEDKSLYIQPTQKNLDNVVRLAKYLIDFNPNKPLDFYNDTQKDFADIFKSTHDKISVNYNPNLSKFLSNENTTLDLTVTLDKNVASSMTGGQIENYSKFRKNYTEFNKLYKEIHENYPKVVENLFNLRETIGKEEFLRSALDRLNSTNRDSHGARVDSQLFMDALIVIEGAFYPKPKLALTNSRDLKNVDNKLSKDSLEIMKNKSSPSLTSPEQTILTIEKIKNGEKNKLSVNKLSPQITKSKRNI
jgi:hypothetical protein